jgi:hypothetical protein
MHRANEGGESRRGCAELLYPRSGSPLQLALPCLAYMIVCDLS